MKLVRFGALSTLIGLMLGVAAPAHGLTCPSRSTLEQKVQYSPNVVIGEIVKIDKKKYSVKVIKVLKDGGLLRNQKTFTIDMGQPRMGSGFGFTPKEGQLILFFLLAVVRPMFGQKPLMMQSLLRLRSQAAPGNEGWGRQRLGMIICTKQSLVALARGEQFC